MATTVSVLRGLAAKGYMEVDRGLITLICRNPATAGSIIKALESARILVPKVKNTRGKTVVWRIDWKKAKEWYPNEIPLIDELIRAQEEREKREAERQKQEVMEYMKSMKPVKEGEDQDEQ